MKLHFAWSEVEELIKEIKAGTTIKPLWEKKTGKGFWLVGDQGVYLMANTTDGPRAKARKENESAFIVYAKECDPTKMEFDECWENKRASFGGDDGAEFIDLEETERLYANPPQPDMKPQYLVRPASFTSRFNGANHRRKLKKPPWHKYADLRKSVFSALPVERLNGNQAHYV